MPEQIPWENFNSKIKEWIESRFGYCTIEWKQDLANSLLPLFKTEMQKAFEQGKNYGIEDERSSGYAYKMKTADFETWYANTYLTKQP